MYSGTFSVDTGFIGAIALLNRDRDLDCIACGSDLIAIGAMKGCYKIGKSIPEEIKIFGFDDNSISKYLNPELTTVNRNTYEMGKIATRILINHLEQGDPLNTITLKHEIVQRGTV